MKEMITSLDFEVAEDLFCITILAGDKTFKVVCEKNASLGSGYDAAALLAQHFAQAIQKHQETIKPAETAPVEVKNE